MIFLIPIKNLLLYLIEFMIYLFELSLKLKLFYCVQFFYRWLHSSCPTTVPCWLCCSALTFQNQACLSSSRGKWSHWRGRIGKRKLGRDRCPRSWLLFPCYLSPECPSWLLWVSLCSLRSSFCFWPQEEPSVTFTPSQW